MSPMAQIRALVARLHSGEPLTPAEAERLAIDALTLRRRLERLRVLVPDVDVELDPALLALADRAAALAPAL